jgi:steroid 5-alpha reductase family enzyme
LPEGLSILRVALCGLALCAGLAALTWLASLARRDVSLVDRMWPVFIASACIVYFELLPAAGPRRICMLALVLAWALRLGIYITRRNWGHAEDRRYQEIRARNQPNFEVKSLYLIFGLQAVLAWIVSAPMLAAAGLDRALNWLDDLGIVLTALGIGFEAVSDWQMSRFRADPANRGQVMDRGLWRYTRHPNYFGESCVWWGLWLMALAAGGVGAAWSVISPVLMTGLLLKVSGVSLLERDIIQRRPQYRDYIERTSAFVPSLPRHTRAR